MNKPTVSLAFHEDGQLRAVFPKGIADNLGRMKLVSFTNDEASACLVLQRSFDGNKGATQPGGRRHCYQFSRSEWIGHRHPFRTTPATASCSGELLVIEVNKAQKPLAACLRDLFEPHLIAVA